MRRRTDPAPTLTAEQLDILRRGWQRCRDFAHDTPYQIYTADPDIAAALEVVKTLPLEARQGFPAARVRGGTGWIADFPAEVQTALHSVWVNQGGRL